MRFFWVSTFLIVDFLWCFYVSVDGSVPLLNNGSIGKDGYSRDTLGQGHSALEDARRAAGRERPVQGNFNHSIMAAAALESQNASADNMHETSQSSTDTKATSATPSPSVQLSCDDGVCVALRDTFIEAVESAPCRSFFENGKCPTACASSLSAVTVNESWTPCTVACTGNDADIFASGASRWLRLCGARTESLIDQGKEAVKTLVAESITTRSSHIILQFLLGVLILALGIGYGYRRGAISAQMAYRVQKRRLLGRKNSDANISV